MVVSIRHKTNNDALESNVVLDRLIMVLNVKVYFGLGDIALKLKPIS